MVDDAQQPVRQTLLPRYSIRLILALMAACGGVFFVFGQAVRGVAWAMGASVGVLSIGVALLVYAALFGLVYMASRAGARLRGARGSEAASARG